MTAHDDLVCARCRRPRGYGCSCLLEYTLLGKIHDQVDTKEENVMMEAPVTQYTIPRLACTMCGRTIPNTEIYSYLIESGEVCLACGNEASFSASGLPHTKDTTGSVYPVTIMACVPQTAVKEEDVDTTIDTSFTISRDVKRKHGSSRRIVYDSRARFLVLKESAHSVSSKDVNISRDDLEDVIVALSGVLAQVVRAETKLSEGRIP